LTEFGLLGTWQNDCRLPPAPNNFRTVYEGLPSGDVRRTYYDGPNKFYSAFVIKRVSRISADQILYEQLGQDDLQFVVLKKVGNRYRIFSNPAAPARSMCKRDDTPETPRGGSARRHRGKPSATIDDAKRLLGALSDGRGEERALTSWRGGSPSGTHCLGRP
jgi:hypothetical protein